jgi:two-component system sensor kinase FixL
MRNGSDALSEILTGKRELAIQTSIAGEDMVEVSVSDTGPGLAEDAMQNAFEPFFTTKPNGTGMGLSISRTIIEAHGGRLWWSNRDGCGTIFSFTLPIDRRPLRHGV